MAVGMMFSGILQSQTARQQEKLRAVARPVATVRVVAYEANGRYLGMPDVRTFVELDNKENLASKFHNGVASGIPYGEYQIEGHESAYFPDSRHIAVYQPFVTIVLGLRFASELPQIPPTLPGHVIGLQGSTEKTFAKLIGVYENVSMESSIDGDGRFTLGGLSSGLFVLLIIGEKGVIASRTLTVPYTGPPLEMEIKGVNPLLP